VQALSDEIPNSQLAQVVTDSRAEVLRHKCWLQGLHDASSACTDLSQYSERLHFVAEM
jgi:hypothetical protein